MCILELSKVPLHKFHYHNIKNKYDNKPWLLFTKTDSLMYAFETEDIYDDFSNNKELFDSSNYSAESRYYNYLNPLVVVKMNDEMGGVAIDEIVGLKPKMNSILVSNSCEYKKAKDVHKNVATM